MGPQYGRRLALAWLAIGTAMAGGRASGALQGGETRPLPPHDYSLVVPAGRGQADTALAVLREGMMRALAQSHLLPAGFPQPGTVVQTPSTAEAGVINVSCSASQGAPRGLNCVRLGPSSYVELSTIDYASARASLFEVFLFDASPTKALKREAASSLTRVVVHYPFFGDDLRPQPSRHLGDVIEALQRGALIAKAKPLLLQ